MKDILLREDGRQVKFTAVQKSRPYMIISRDIFVESSVADPDPNPDPPDPHVFGPPGSGSISQRYRSGSGSGSFYQQA
jgi:hypothetical protein